jgi:hypothetical protein
MRAPYSMAGILLTAGLLYSSGAGIKPAAAADANHVFAVHGIGSLSCLDVSKALSNGDAGVRDVLASWVFGYVTAINRNEPATYDLTPVQDGAALVNMVVGVCQKNSTTPVETVVNAVFQSLAKAKLPASSPEIMVTVGKQETVLRVSTLEKLQQVLASLKYMPTSDANGKFGRVTQVALIKFQTAQHMPQSGLPDPATVVRALVEMPNNAAQGRAR